ncbi:MAG: RICIN domain-containing protein [Verrucomicrobiia bacterium]
MKSPFRFRPLCSRTAIAAFHKLAPLTLVLLGLAGCATAPSGAAARGIPSGWVVLREQHSGKLVSVPPARNVLQWSRRDGADQLWRTEPHADGTVSLVSAASGLALEGATDPAPGGEVFVTQPTGAPNQRWQFKPQPDGTVVLVSAAKGLALDIMDNALEDGWIVLLWTESGAPNQRWTKESTQDGLLRLRVQHSGLYLTTTPGQRDDGADVAIWSDVGAHWQQWRIEPVGNDFRLVNRHSGKALQLSREIHTQKIDIEQGTPDGRADQLWRIEPAGDRWWKFLSASNGTSFDVMVRATADGSNLWSYEFNGGDNQLFRIEKPSR